MKMPRTLHLEGSGGITESCVKISSLIDKFIVIEEKIDGTDVNISFDNNANVSIQTRAHVATAKQFNKLHSWANENINKIWDLISDRYIIYGQYCNAKHTIFYDNLCHFFIETDMYDRKTNKWLSTFRRQELISSSGIDIICSVPILKIGKINFKDELQSLVLPSFYKTEKWKDRLQFFCDKYHYDFSKIMSETDDSILSEGLYVKHEDKDTVLARYKYVREDFLNTIIKSGSHYMDRALIQNMVAEKC